MRYCLLFWLISTSLLFAKEAQRDNPFELNVSSPAKNRIDAYVGENLKNRKLEPANMCSDAVFLRRVYLGVTGTLPTSQEARTFLADKNPAKRASLINKLLSREEFSDYWAMKWCDVLRVKSEFPINLWPNAVQAYHRWVHDAISTNMPYNLFAKELLCSSGSNVRVPQVNFYRAIQGREPNVIAEAAALTFMGTRIENWSAEQKSQIAAFFSNVAYKSTAEWKEEIVLPDATKLEPINTKFPDGTSVHIGPEQDPRAVFAEWLVSPRNQWFAKCVVNRIWYWLMGRGIIHSPDDLRPDNKPINQELLSYLEQELVNSRYDLRHIYKLILNSRTYQQSSLPGGDIVKCQEAFACFSVRRMDAEVLVDALEYLTGGEESYTSAIPEPFTYIPPGQRTITLADGSITSSFLEMFGRPARDTGMVLERNSEPSDQQSLYLLNSTEIQRGIQNCPVLRNIIRDKRRSPKAVVSELYLAVLSRYPTMYEEETALSYMQKHDMAKAVSDIAWALINTKEFLYLH